MRPVAHIPIRRKLSVWASFRRRVQQLGPDQSLLLRTVPLGMMQPLRIVAVVVSGKGHWLSGAVTIAAAYVMSLLITERLFRLVKPKLMMLDWFAKIWAKASSISSVVR